MCKRPLDQRSPKTGLPLQHWTMSTLDVGDTKALADMPVDGDHGAASTWVRVHDNTGEAQDFVERAAPLAGHSTDWRTPHAAHDVPRRPVFSLTTAVVTAQARPKDIFDLVNKSTANILVIIWDPQLVDAAILHHCQRRSLGAPQRSCKDKIFERTQWVAHDKLREKFERAARKAFSKRTQGKRKEEEEVGDEEKGEQKALRYWVRGPDLFHNTGLVFYAARVVRDIARTDRQTEDKHHVNTVLQVRLREWRKNPGAEFHIAVPARYQLPTQPQSRLQGDCPDWSDSFWKSVVKDVWDFDVRFLTGFFDCEERTLERLGEEIGLQLGDKPFHVTFRTDQGLVNHPNYTFALGAHSPQHPVYADGGREQDAGLDLEQGAVNLPGWLRPGARGFWKTLLQHYMRNDVPTWGSPLLTVPQLRHKVKEQARMVLKHREDARQELPQDPAEVLRNEHVARKRKAWLKEVGLVPPLVPAPLPSLGKVASKRLKEEHLDKCWKEGVHQNMIFVGQSQPSSNSRAECTKKWRKRMRKK